MKRLLIGLLVLGSFSSFALDESVGRCTIDLSKLYVEGLVLNSKRPAGFRTMKKILLSKGYSFASTDKSKLIIYPSFYEDTVRGHHGDKDYRILVRDFVLAEEGTSGIEIHKAGDFTSRSFLASSRGALIHFAKIAPFCD